MEVKKDIFNIFYEYENKLYFLLETYTALTYINFCNILSKNRTRNYICNRKSTITHVFLIMYF